MKPGILAYISPYSHVPCSSTTELHPQCKIKKKSSLFNFFSAVGEPKASQMLGKHFTIMLQPQPFAKVSILLWWPFPCCVLYIFQKLSRQLGLLEVGRKHIWPSFLSPFPLIHWPTSLAGRDWYNHSYHGSSIFWVIWYSSLLVSSFWGRLWGW